MVAASEYHERMALEQQISDDMKAAMKARDTQTVSTLRMVIAGIKNLRAESGHGDEVTDDEVVGVITKQAKQRRESIESYTSGGRPELAESEERELEILQHYLPKQLSDDEVADLVDQAIAETGASSPGDLGTVMKAVMPKVGGRADGKQVNAVVRERLT